MNDKFVQSLIVAASLAGIVLSMAFGMLMTAAPFVLAAYIIVEYIL
jgi:hypothetical protein